VMNDSGTAANHPKLAMCPFSPKIATKKSQMLPCRIILKSRNEDDREKMHNLDQVQPLQELEQFSTIVLKGF